MARDEHYARRALAPFLADFHAAAVTGVRAARSDYPRTGHIHRKTTRRSITRDHIVYDLRGRVEGHERVRVSDRNQTTYFVVDGEIGVLVKMASDDGAVALNQTQAALDFQCNQPDLYDYDGTNLYLSYVENEADPHNPSIYLICPSATGHHWMFEIEPPAAEISGEISNAPLPEAGDDLIRLPAAPIPQESE